MEGTDGKPENRYGFVFDERVTPEVLAEEELDYLGEIFQNKIDDYTFLAYEKIQLPETVIIWTEYYVMMI